MNMKTAKTHGKVQAPKGCCRYSALIYNT